MECASNLRQIGVAVHLYTAENKGALPGPLYAAQASKVNVTNSLVKRLSSYIASSIEDRDGVQVSLYFECPAWKKASGGNTDYNVFYVNPSVTLETGEKLRPFGYPGSQDPLKLVQIPCPSITYALVDLDTGIKDEAASLPRPAHKITRTWLFLDGHVEAKSVN